jgi:hypothetical protein
MKANYEELRRYYASAYWQTVRGKLLFERGGRCEKCSSSKMLQAHHVRYDHLFSELSHMNDLLLLCSVCHAKVERDKKRKKPLKRGLLGRFIR